MNKYRSISEKTGRRGTVLFTVSGMTLIETLVAVGIAGILMAVAVPLTKNSLKSYRLSAAVQAVSGAIQSTRYQAISKGYHYTITFDPATKQYQVASKIPPAAVFSNVGNAVLWSASADVSITPLTTIEFSPGCTVSATTGTLSFSLTNGTSTETITVSTVGNVSVTP